jgi:hypothetical protein
MKGNERETTAAGRAKDDQPRGAQRASRRSPHADKRVLAALAASLRRRVAYAKAALLIADALDLPARDLLAYKAPQFRAALRHISASRFEEVVQALCHLEPPRRGRVRDPTRRSLDEIACMALALCEPGSKLALVEQAIVDRAMSQCDGNQSATARMLGVQRKALARRLARMRSEERS